MASECIIEQKQFTLSPHAVMIARSNWKFLPVEIEFIKCDAWAARTRRGGARSRPPWSIGGSCRLPKHPPPPLFFSLFHLVFHPFQNSFLYLQRVFCMFRQLGPIPCLLPAIWMSYNPDHVICLSRPAEACLCTRSWSFLLRWIWMKTWWICGRFYAFVVVG